MNVWCTFSTIFCNRLALRIIVLLVITVGIITTLFLGTVTQASPGINKTLSFQGRLLDSNGDVVPDDSYNIQFTIYEDGSGDEAGNPDGVAVWTETYRNDTGSTGVTVRNGFMSVNLGSQTSFGTLVDWNNDTLWLSMNIAGSAEACLTFGTAPCVDDGEMLPMKRLTATPYALNAGQLGGKSADEFIQLASGVQNDTTNSSSIFINKTGSGSLIQLQNAGTDVFTLSNSGDISLGGVQDKTISVGTAAEDTAGSDLLLVAGSGGTGLGANGGNTTIQGGEAGGTDGNGGDVVLSGGVGTGYGVNGQVIISNPTFATATEDASCYTNGAPVADSCSISQSSVDTAAAVLVGFSTPDQWADLPDPTLTTAGRTFYILTPAESEPFILTYNIYDEIVMRPNTNLTLIWNGEDWTRTDSLSDQILTDPYNGTNVQIGNSDTSDGVTVLTLDHADSAPDIDGNLVGSMYYDTTLNRVQCYEGDGWGTCSAEPDVFISLTPEYTNAVTHGTGLGSMESGICSDSLNINDGSLGQPTVCGTNETHNYYSWTSTETTAQTKSIYVSYTLPETFEVITEDSVSLLGRTDSSDANITYEIFRSNGSTGLTACTAAISVSTGSQTSWQTGSANGANDPQLCGIVPGDTVVIKINLTASNDAHAYVGTLRFAYN